MLIINADLAFLAQMGPPENAGGDQSNFLELILLVVLLFLLVAAIILIVVGFWYFRIRSQIDQIADGRKTAIIENTSEFSDVKQETTISLPGAIRDLEQQRVLKVLLQNGGQMLQRELPEALGMSKSTVSRLITDLENQGIITRKPYKKTLLITITPAFEEI